MREIPRVGVLNVPKGFDSLYSLQRYSPSCFSESEWNFV
jgi:hypothetical protein